ncbi:MAG TPA: carbon-nitrogen hydrolase family protein [Puia sp.]|nr:carbon-nitrogen hydrolase family protein [Puia sp.]
MASGSYKKFKIAAAQATPVFLDKKATTEKACEWIHKASSEGAKLIVFPETFIPAYPEWVWMIPAGKKPLMNQVFEELMANAVTIPDDTTQQLCAAARKSKIHVAIGINERNDEASGASLYNSILYIDDDGNIMGKHHKLVPTGGERLMWAPGDGSTLVAFDTRLGKIGGLICWENYMPLARYTMYSMGVQIYVAPTWDYGEVWLSSLRHIAKEGGAFVIGCGMPLQCKDIPDKYEFKKLYPADKDWINPGGSCIIAPNGNFIAGPVNKKEELLIAELDLSMIADGKWMLDTAGHYARPDVFRFGVNRNANKIMDSES